MVTLVCSLHCLLTTLVAAPPGIDFPGPPPGAAQATGRFTLENAVLGASWELRDGHLRPTRLVNKLTGTAFDQTGAELFRLATPTDAPVVPGVVVGVRLDADRVVALVSRDGVAWTELAAFPRADFPGEPRLVRLGKMNLKAQPKNNPDLGAPGEATLTELSPPSPALPDGRWTIAARAHQAAVKEYPFPAGTRQISCRIDKGTDQGMSWGPALALVWDDGQRFLLVGVREHTSVFNIVTAAGEQIKGAAQASYPRFDLPASDFRLVGEPRLVTLAPAPAGVRAADGCGGVALEAELASDRGVTARWRAELRDGSNYLRQTLDLRGPGAPVALAGVELCDARVPDAATVGQCPGCPVAGSGWFCGVEIPGARNAVSATGARIGFGCQLTLSPAQSYSFGAVTGVAPAGQLRRAFLCYVERERARPSRPLLHYNCWYDLGYGVDAKGMLDVVRQFDTELVRKRGVPVESYLVDDGWDDPGRGLWVEHLRKFPGGFAELRRQMAQFGAHLGVWISPLGGYGGDRERTAWARKLGLIPPAGNFDLAQPGYRQWFADRCLQLMKEDGVNAFKWDRAGEGVSPHLMALLDIAHTLRAQNPDVFINVTVGTWPSPFWLNHVDSTWRMGTADVGWEGPGDDRERWLTFRDSSCRRMFVEQSPLYPLNSAMHHGLVHGRCFQGDKVGKAGPNLLHEARSYFATGTSLQELYLTPSMMTADAWDRVAEAAKWAKAHADILRDAHWVGGDPHRLEPYGYAAWSPRGATLMLRNPDAAPHTIDLDAGTVFELPAGAAQRYALRSPYADQRVQGLELAAGTEVSVALEPFEVLVFDAAPVTGVATLERSYWVHASLGRFTQRGYWGPDFAAPAAPTQAEVERAAKLLTGVYGANRLYLIYHRELPLAEVGRLWGWWRAACPPEVELMPALVLRMYDQAATPVFTAAEAGELADLARATLKSERCAVYDVLPNRAAPEAQAELVRRYPGGLVRVGLQPGEALGPPFVGAVEDTWSGFCHGTRNAEDWLAPGFGAATLRGWVAARNAGAQPIAWDLITVAWDYRATPRGAYPGYDDAERNQPLPAGRNALAAKLIVETADRARLAGFSSDLYILNENSRSAAHDGRAGCFYATLRAGREYDGYYATPLREIAALYRGLAAGRLPGE